MDFGDADSEKWFEYNRTAPWPLSLAFRLEGRKVRSYERRLGAQFDACSVNAPRERDVLRAYVPTPIHVIPNGVDLEYFRARREPSGTYIPHRLIFTGNMSYRPNVDAVGHLVANILPRVRAEIPDVELHIVGMDPTPAVRKLGDGARVVVTGRVDDVRPYFQDAAVAVVPLRVARGLQNKVLEAMAMRVPVGVRLLREPAVRERYAAAGRACVEENHNWSALLPRLEELVTGPLPLRSATTSAGRDGA